MPEARTATDKDLVVLTDNKEVMAFYGAYQNQGVEDVQDDVAVTPQIKLTAGNHQNFLMNGKKATTGMLYHTELKEEYEHLDVVLVAVTKIYLPKFDPDRVPGTKIPAEEMKLNYVFGGFRCDDNTPFMMYVKGMSLQPLWDFLGELASIRVRYRLPMFALKVRIGVQQRESETWGQVDCYKFGIFRNKETQVPTIEQDMGKLTFYKDSIEGFKLRFAAIAKKGTTEEDENIKVIEEADTPEEPPIPDEPLPKELTEAEPVETKDTPAEAEDTPAKARLRAQVQKTTAKVKELKEKAKAQEHGKPAQEYVSENDIPF